jgi:hypothetical protein
MNRKYSFAISTASTLEHISDAHYLWMMTNMPWFSKEDLRGYSIRQAFSEQEDVPYGAAMSVCKAAHQFLEHELTKDHMKFFFPVIVINSPLLTCSLSADGNLQLDEVAQGEFIFNIPGMQPSTIRVVTEPELESFVTTARIVTDQLRETLKTEEERLYKLNKIAAWRQRAEMPKPRNERGKE